MRCNLYWSLAEIVARSAQLVSATITEAECDAIGQHLQILRPTPVADLARGRSRVLAEAAGLALAQGQARKRSRATKQRLEIAFALLVMALMAGGFAVTTPEWYSTHGGNPISNLFSTPTLALAPAKVIVPSATSINDMTPSMSVSRMRTGIALTAIPEDLPGSAPVSKATPGPLLTLTRSTQTQPAR
jgi:hypothetical protein